MKPLSLIKLLTLASFFVLCASYANSATVLRGDVDDQTPCSDYKDNQADCERWKADYKRKKEKDDADKAEAKADKAKAEAESAKEKFDAKCEAALSKYDTAVKETAEECARFGEGTSAECRRKANECASNVSGGFESNDGDSAVASITNLINVYGKMQNGAGNSAVDEGCVTDDPDAEKREVERIDDKITRLREEMQDIKEKAVAADKELAEKKQDVEKEMLDVEKDAEKAKFEKQTKNQEDAGRMQKSIVNSEKKRRDNILKIADLNVDIANFTFAHQKLNLALSDSRITKECRDKSVAAMNLKVKGTIDPKSGKEIRPKFTQRESMQFKKDLKQEESNCIQEKALQRLETTKALVDAKRKVKVQIDTLSASNVDEEKAIANEIKQMEALKAIAAEEEAKAIEAKIKKLNSLNKTVTDMDKYVTDKKKSYDEKTKAKNDLIEKLQFDRQNVKPKFKKVIKNVKSSGLAASAYLNMCCNFTPTTDNHTDCSRVTDDEPAAKTSKTKSVKPGRVK